MIHWRPNFRRNTEEVRTCVFCGANVVSNKVQTSHWGVYKNGSFRSGVACKSCKDSLGFKKHPRKP